MNESILNPQKKKKKQKLFLLDLFFLSIMSPKLRVI
jgi:hypothetical protein